MTIVEFIIDELKNYKLNKAIILTLDNELTGSLKAQTLSDMPKSVTNKFNSVVENEALNECSEISDIKKSVNRVEIWLNMLHDEERHVVRELFINNRTYHMISNSWSTYYCRTYWQKKRKIAMHKIQNNIKKTMKNW